MEQNALEKYEIVRIKEVLQVTGVSRMTIWRWVKAGAFPEPHDISPNGTKGWKRTELEDWVRRREEGLLRKTG